MPLPICAESPVCEMDKEQKEEKNVDPMSMDLCFPRTRENRKK